MAAHERQQQNKRQAFHAFSHKDVGTLVPAFLYLDPLMLKQRNWWQFLKGPRGPLHQIRWLKLKNLMAKMRKRGWKKSSDQTSIHLVLIWHAWSPQISLQHHMNQGRPINPAQDIETQDQKFKVILAKQQAENQHSSNSWSIACLHISRQCAQEGSCYVQSAPQMPQRATTFHD